MRRPLLLLLLPALVLASLSLSGHTEAIYAVGANVVAVSWMPGQSITYRINNQIGSAPNIQSGSNATAAVDSAFATMASATGLGFVNGGPTVITSVGIDGTNLVTFANNATNSSIVGGAIAITIFTYNTSNYRITEADVVFNSATQFATNSSASAQDIQSVAMHELGHFVGQKHSPVMSATMFPFNINGATHSRTLSEDDQSGLGTLYPGTAGALFGTVTGTIRRSPFVLVSGAHVVLTDAITGRVRSAGVTLQNGTFSVARVPPGLYTAYAEPLDGPFPAASLNGGYWNPGTMDTTFRTAFYGSNATPTIFAVRAGLTTSLGNLTVTGTASLNVIGMSLSTVPNAFSAYSSVAISVSPPYSQYLAIGGPGINALPDSAFDLEGPFLAITGASTLSGVFTGSSDGYKVFPIFVAAGTPPGGYSVRVTNAATGEIAFLTAGIDVRAPTTPAAYTVPYLAPCVGSLGPVQLSSTTLPTVGNAGFTLSIVNTLAGQTGYFLLAGRPDIVPVLPNCVLPIDLTSLFILFPGVVVPLTQGVTNVAAGIPSTASLAGADLYLCFAVTDPLAAGGIAITNGLLIHIH